jgi:hypothetical protein
MTKITDLSYKPKRKDTNTEHQDPPMGVMILTLLPFAYLFYRILLAGLIG